MRDLHLAFSPNRTVSSSTALIIAGSQAAVLLVVWSMSSFEFFPSLAESTHALHDLWMEGLGRELFASFWLNLQAIAVATGISLLLAYATVIPFFRPVVAFISKLRFLSLIGLTFFFMMATNDGHALKLDLLAFSITVFFVTSMVDVLNAIPRVQYDLSRTLRMGEWRLVWEVIIVGQADKVFDVLRQNAAVGWMALSMVEGTSRSGGGIGTLLLDENKHFHFARVLILQALILSVGLGQDYIIGVLKGYFCPYASLTLERK